MLEQMYEYMSLFGVVFFKIGINLQKLFPGSV